MLLGFYMHNSWYVADFANRRKLEFLSCVCVCELLRGFSITVLEGVFTSGQAPFAHLQGMLQVCPVQMWLFKNPEVYKQDKR